MTFIAIQYVVLCQGITIAEVLCFVPLNSVDDCVIFSLGFENETNAKETLQQSQKRKTFHRRLFSSRSFTCITFMVSEEKNLV